MSSRAAMDTDVSLAESRDDRRAFISEFASKMQKVEDLKIEGGIPRDERRETLRAMGASPLRKVVLIGVNSPAGNTWGLHGADIESHGIKYVSSSNPFSLDIHLGTCRDDEKSILQPAWRGILRKSLRKVY